MNRYREPEREIPIIHTVDVLVCGGGPAGVGAAVVAGRQGVSTMVVESMDCLGGTATAGLMSAWGGRSSSQVMQEIFERTHQKWEILGDSGDERVGLSSIHHEAQKIVLDELMRETGVRILFCTIVCGAIVEQDRVRGVIVENKSGRGVILAKCVIDATGDGDVAAYAGVPYTKGRKEDGKMQPCTLMFNIGGVDYEKAVFPGSFETKVFTEKGELQSLAKTRLPFPAGHVLLYPNPVPQAASCNMTNDIDIDGTDAESITKGILDCRSQIEPIIEFLHEYVPGYEKCWLMSSASMLGIRETRHFEGIETLAEDTILQAKLHDDWVVRRAYFNFDVHNITGSGLDKTGVQHEWKQPDDYSIPYGCLVPKKIEGLLLSGRNISGSHLAHSNFRIMSVCIALGEAAGAAAALAVKNSQALKEVDVCAIQKIVGDNCS